MNENDIINCLPEGLQEDEIQSTVYSLSNTISNKIFNSKDTISNIDTNDTSAYGIGISFCNCANYKYFGHYYGHIVIGDLRIIKKKSARLTKNF